jgi:hypothetical protein
LRELNRLANGTMLKSVGTEMLVVRVDLDEKGRRADRYCVRCQREAPQALRDSSTPPAIQASTEPAVDLDRF